MMKSEVLQQQKTKNKLKYVTALSYLMMENVAFAAPSFSASSFTDNQF